MGVRVKSSSSVSQQSLSSSSWVSSQNWDAIVVGAGAAGLYTALCLPQDWQILLLSKEALKRSASGWAQGGIAAAIAPSDSAELHIADTLAAGAGLCEPAAVQFLVDHAPECIESLVELGVAFDRTDGSLAGSLAMTREAAHSRPRVLHAADRTGKAVVTTLAEQALQRENIQVQSGVFVLRLWMEAARCRGVVLLAGGRLIRVRSPRIILATGGGGQVFSNTTNPPLSTGDGIALAHDAGAQLRDLEFFQFHPTALMKPGAPRFLISEAVRGEGAYLRDDAGDRFMLQYHPDGELAPRDVVSRSIFQHLQKTGRDHVWLDLSAIPVAQVRHRFPNIIRVCQKWGVDLFAGPIPVAPAAHYWMGGIVTDHWGQTTVPGLYAVGEAASTGVHGANRLASNSLLECIVFGRRLGQQSAGLQLEPERPDEAGPDEIRTDETPLLEDPSIVLSGDEGELTQIVALRQSLSDVLWAGAGICRNRPGMEQALEEVRSLRAQFLRLPSSQTLLTLDQCLKNSRIPGQKIEKKDGDRFIRAWGELENLLTVGELILKSALFREESRGGHYRLDFPEPRQSWRTHTLLQGERLWRSQPIPDDPKNPSQTP